MLANKMLEPLLILFLEVLDTDFEILLERMRRGDGVRILMTKIKALLVKLLGLIGSLIVGILSPGLGPTPQRV